MEFAPLCLRKISLGPSSDSDQKCMAMQGLSVNQRSESRHQEREVSLELYQISMAKGAGTSLTGIGSDLWVRMSEPVIRILRI